MTLEQLVFEVNTGRVFTTGHQGLVLSQVLRGSVANASQNFPAEGQGGGGQGSFTHCLFLIPQSSSPKALTLPQFYITSVDQADFGGSPKAESREMARHVPEVRLVTHRDCPLTSSRVPC